MKKENYNIREELTELLREINFSGYNRTRSNKYRFASSMGEIYCYGGFARRTYMIENDIFMNADDKDKGDIDVYVSYDRLMRNFEFFYDLDVSNAKSPDMEIRNMLCNNFIPSVLKTLVTRKDAYSRILGGYCPKIQCNEYQLIDSHLKIFSNSLYVNTGKRKITIPLTPNLQIIACDDVVDEVNKFDMEVSKFSIEFPFTSHFSKKVGNVSDNKIYYIDEIYLSPDTFNPMKTLKRLEKYSNYGFFISEDVVSEYFSRVKEYEKEGNAIASTPHLLSNGY